MPSPDFDNNAARYEKRTPRKRKKSSFGDLPRSHSSVKVLLHCRTFGKSEPFGKGLKTKERRIPEKLYPPKIGDAVHFATYDALTQDKVGYLQSFLFNSKTHSQIEEDLRFLFGFNPRRYLGYDDFVQTIVDAGMEMAGLVLGDVRGNSVFIIEPSLTPVSKRFRRASAAVYEEIKAGTLDEFTVVEAAGPFGTLGDEFHHLPKRTRDNLRIYSGPSTVHADKEKTRLDVACDGIRADFLEVNWQDVAGNEDMRDIIPVLDMIKRGDSSLSVRRDILNFESWVNNIVTYNGEDRTAAEVFRIFLDKIHKGHVKVTINEIKAHAANISYIHAKVDNSESPFVDASQLDPDLVRDISATSQAFLHLALNFDDRLRDRRFAAQFMRNVEVQVLEANLRLAEPTGERHQSIKAKEFRRKKAIIKRCRIKVLDLMRGWVDRDNEIRADVPHPRKETPTNKKTKNKQFPKDKVRSEILVEQNDVFTHAKEE